MGAFSDSTATPQTINPGIYTSIALSGPAVVTLNPGVYVIKGPFTAVNGSTITGTGVTLYFTCSGYPAQTNDSSCPSGGGTGGYFSGTGGSNTTLSAPTSTNDPYTNLLMFYDRNDTGAFTGTSCGTGNTDFLDNGSASPDSLTGTIYAKSAQICMGGGIYDDNTQFVIGALSLVGSASITANVVASQQVSQSGSSGVTALIG
jgi:hypothetical protein